MPVAVAGAAVAAGASLIGSSEAAGAANKSASLQAQTAAANAARSQPYIDTGDAANALLKYYNNDNWNLGNEPDYLSLAEANQPVVPQAMTQAALEQTPGYQFTLNQGLQATQNSAAQRGLGVSGAAMKGAAAYATGLANSNYQQQFQNQQQLFGNQQTIEGNYLNLNTAQQGNTQSWYNRTANTANMGANAASGVATNQSGSAATQGGYIQGAGNAAAAGAVGVGTAATGAAQNYLGYNALQGYLGMNGGGGAGTPTNTVMNPATGTSYQSSPNAGQNF